MPVNVRVNVPEVKAEVDLSCDLRTSFWHLKLCLVDGLLSFGQNVTPSSTKPPDAQALMASTNDCEKRPLMQLVMSNLNSSRKQDSDTGSKSSCMPSSTSRTTTTTTTTNSSIISTTIRRGQRRHNSIVSSSRCHSSASSLSSSDTSSTSISQALKTSDAARSSSSVTLDRSQRRCAVPKTKDTSACYYGFSGVAMADWDDDNARQSNDLSDDGEDPAVKAVEVVTTDPGCYDALSNHYNESNNIVGISQFHDDGCRIGDLSELDERDERDEYNVYECLAYEKEEESNNVCCDRLEELDVKSMGALANSRLFEQLIQSGYLNYGFYSFSLAKFIDDQTNLTDYLSLVSSSTGISYYLDLEFKLKQRHQTTPQTSLSSAYASTNYSSSSTTNSFAFHFRNVSGDGLSLNGSYQNYFYTNNDTLFDSSSLNSNSKLNNFSFSLLSQRIKRNHSISNCSNESQTNISIHNHQQQHSFTNNMIAKLASSNGAPSQKASSGQTKANAISSASQSKRKRSKLLDLLLNTNWSKQSQQASNLMKLNKVLLVCDANFLDEKTGESPLSLVITSPQINETQVTTKTNRIRTTAGATTTNGCPQSTSLFDLQSQHSTTSHNMLSLQQTSAVELSQSKAPLVEKVLLLLIKSGALIDFRNNDGRTPLHIAAMKSNFWALKTLLDLEASTSAIDINGLIPLFYSILHKAELKVTQLLLNHMSTQRNPSRLDLSVGNHNQQADAVANAGICKEGLEIADQHGWQAIHYAAKYGLSGHLEKLLYHGCDINAKISGSGNTPLHVAAINDQLQVAKVLLLRGASKTITNNSHQTAHQVAVISSNMNLAEFIASHDETKVVPFGPNNLNSNNNSMPVNNRRSLTSSMNHLTNKDINRSSRSSMQQLISSNLQPPSIIKNPPAPNQQVQRHSMMPRTGIIQPQPQEIHVHQQQHSQQELASHTNQRLNPLTLDVANHYSTSITSSAPTTNTSGSSQQTGQSSLLSIDSSSSLHNNQLNVQVNNISPCLSQRSCATSNTTNTSSSGVCCDGEGTNNLEETSGGNPKNGVLSSNVTIISISNNAKEPGLGSHQLNLQDTNESNTTQQLFSVINDNNINRRSALIELQQLTKDSLINGQNEGEDFSGSESSDELHSLMSEKKPLFVGSIVRATNCYESGDPKHLQLRREDLVEILEYPTDLVQAGRLPRLANKLMLFGRRLSDGNTGLFPSFCVRRTKQKSTASRQTPLQDVTNISNQQQHYLVTANELHQQQPGQAFRGNNLPESQSMVALGPVYQHQEKVPAMATNRLGNQQHQNPKVSFREFRVTLSKFQNDGFGFVLRGARIDPATMSGGDASSKISIDEHLMAANKLASLQYFSDIEPNSVAHQNGLKRGDFLVSVNNQDIRLCSHEQVVQMIRQSGDKVLLTIARSLPLIVPGSSKTLARVKPEPPKRDPTTTLTRNKTMRVKSLLVSPQVQRQQQQGQRFNADKPLPETPQNGMIASPSSLNRSVSTNLSDFNSANSLSSSVAPDAQSITSISTVGSGQVADSSSSTTTLTTVATTKPRAAPKPEGINLKAATIVGNAIQLSQNPHQSALVVTTKRPSMDQTTHMIGAQRVSAIGPSVNGSQIQIPPPPPPLPDFSITLTKDRLSQRRTSAPINQAAPLIQISKDQLLRKRESLVSVATNDFGSNAADGASAICAVAAACAAAANSRLQRKLEQQNQKQEDQIPRDTQSNQAKGSMTNEEKVLEAAAKRVEKEAKNSTETTTTKQKTNDLLTTAENINSTQVDNGMSCNETQRSSHNDQGMGSHRFMQSATLGRKSSAQIIQQPKSNSNIGHSQTLRIASTKRMSILDYDAFPEPPPPSIPPPVPKIFSDQEITFENQRQRAEQLIKNNHTLSQHHSHQASHRGHHHHHQAQQHQCERHSMTRDVPEIDRYAMNQVQLQNQHQLIFRQQQQVRQRQIQEQIRLQQLQQQQRCRHDHRVDYGYQTHFDPVQTHNHEYKHASNHHHNHQHHYHHLPQYQVPHSQSISHQQQQQLAYNNQRALQHCLGCTPNSN